jgi:hypothetical protein
LIADALQMETCAIAGFVDDVLELLLGIDGQQETVLLMMCIGGFRHDEAGGAQAEVGANSQPGPFDRWSKGA